MQIYHQNERTWLRGFPPLAPAGRAEDLVSTTPSALFGLDCDCERLRLPNSSISGDVGLLREDLDFVLDLFGNAPRIEQEIETGT